MRRTLLATLSLRIPKGVDRGDQVYNVDANDTFFAPTTGTRPESRTDWSSPSDRSSTLAGSSYREQEPSGAPSAVSTLRGRRCDRGRVLFPWTDERLSTIDRNGGARRSPSPRCTPPLVATHVRPQPETSAHTLLVTAHVASPV